MSALFNNRLSSVAACVAVLWALSPGTLRAQTLYEPEARQGYYLALGVGAGLTVNDTDNHGTLRTWAGQGLSLRFGESLNDWATVGLSIDSAAAQGQRRQGTVFGLGFDTTARLWRELVLSAGLGFGVVQVADKDADSLAEAEGGVSPRYSLGVSYSFFPFYDDGDGSGGWALSPVVQVSHAPSGSARATVVLLAAEVAWWSGLEDNKLVPVY